MGLAMRALLLSLAHGAVVALESRDAAETALAAAEFAVLGFYAPWCGHCKKLAPEYETLGAELESKESKVLVAKVDATSEAMKPFAQEFGVRGYPTLLWKSGGEYHKFNAARNAAGMLEWIGLAVGGKQELVKYDKTATKGSGKGAKKAAK